MTEQELNAKEQELNAKEQELNTKEQELNTKEQELNTRADEARQIVEEAKQKNDTEHAQEIKKRDDKIAEQNAIIISLLNGGTPPADATPPTSKMDEVINKINSRRQYN